MKEPFEREIAALRTAFSCDTSELQVRCLKNAHICPSTTDPDALSPLHCSFGGVRDKRGDFVEESAVYRGLGIPVLVKDPRGRLEHAERNLSGASLYAGPLFYHFGHFIAESTSRLWRILDRNYDHIIFQAPPGGADHFTPYQEELFKLLGIIDRVVIIHRPTRCDELDVPEPAWVLGRRPNRRFGEVFKAASDSFLSQGAIAGKERAKTSEKIYISRTKLGEGVICGEELLEEKLRDAGFVILHPEQMSVEEQICAFYNATIILGVAGSGMHNLLFARENCKSVIIVRDRTTLANFLAIDSASGRQSEYIDGIDDRLYGDFPPFDAQGPFLLAVEHVMSRLKDLGIIEGDSKYEVVREDIERRYLAQWHSLKTRKQLEMGRA